MLHFLSTREGGLSKRARGNALVSVTGSSTAQPRRHGEVCVGHDGPQSVRLGPVGAAPLLAVRRIGIRFGGIVALNDVSFDLEAGRGPRPLRPDGARQTPPLKIPCPPPTPDTPGNPFLGAS